MDGPTLYNTTFNPIHSQYDWFVIFLLKSTYFLIFSHLRAFLTISKECSRKKSLISPLTHMKDQTLNLEKGQHRRGLINTVTWLCSGPTKFSHLVAIAEVGQVHQFDPQMIDGTGHYSINLGTLDKNVCKLHSLFNSPLCSIQNWLRLGCSIFFVLWYNHRSFDLRLVELHIVCLKFFLIHLWYYTKPMQSNEQLTCHKWPSTNPRCRGQLVLQDFKNIPNSYIVSSLDCITPEHSMFNYSSTVVLYAFAISFIMVWNLLETIYTCCKMISLDKASCLLGTDHLWPI